MRIINIVLQRILSCVQSQHGLIMVGSALGIRGGADLAHTTWGSGVSHWALVFQFSRLSVTLLPLSSMWMCCSSIQNHNFRRHEELPNN